MAVGGSSVLLLLLLLLLSCFSVNAFNDRCSQSSICVLSLAAKTVLPHNVIDSNRRGGIIAAAAAGAGDVRCRRCRICRMAAAAPSTMVVRSVG